MSCQQPVTLVTNRKTLHEKRLFDFFEVFQGGWDRLEETRGFVDDEGLVERL